MLSKVTLEFDHDPELIEMEDIFKYDGSKDFDKLKALEAIADTRDMSLSFLGDVFPSLEKLRLNNSIIPSIRDIGTTFSQLRFLSLAHCGLSSLDGITTLSQNLEELYLAFNHIKTVSDLLGLNRLRVIDLEENEITKIEEISLLSCCPKLKAITLQGNPAADSESYREDVLRLVPQCVYLDEKRLKPRKQVKIVQEVVIEPIAIAKIEKGPKVEEKPRSAEEKHRDVVITEQMRDEVNERPPTSRAHYDTKALGSSWLSTPKSKKIKPKQIVTPTINRPVSSSRKVRMSEGF